MRRINSISRFFFGSGLIITFSMSCAMGGPDPDSNTKYVSMTGNDSWAGTFDKPWKTINKAAATLTAGQRLYIRGGTYTLTENINPVNSGTSGNWITYQAYPGETPIIDAINVPINNPIHGWPAYEQGAFNGYQVDWIRVKGLTIENSHGAGILFRKCNNIEVINNRINTTYSPGIACWKGNWNDYTAYRYFKVYGNYLTNTNSWDMEGGQNPTHSGEPPHEAISMAGVKDFEVAWNELYACDKEGIDAKEDAARGVVHHNYIHGLSRQGLYVDGWFALLEDIEFHHNVVTDNEVGIGISSENGPNSRNIRIHHNLVYKNRAPGIYFSEWGDDNQRSDVVISNNTVWQNGIGTPDSGQPYRWLSGGIYLATDNILNVLIDNNIVSENVPFQIGTSDRWTGGELASKNVTLPYNLLYQSATVTYPSWTWSPLNDKNNWVTPVGTGVYDGLPGFTDAANDVYTLASGSPCINAGDPDPGYNDGDGSRNDIGFMYRDEPGWGWWLSSFPPIFP